MAPDSEPTDSNDEPISSERLVMAIRLLQFSVVSTILGVIAVIVLYIWIKYPHWIVM